MFYTLVRVTHWQFVTVNCFAKTTRRRKGRFPTLKQQVSAVGWLLVSSFILQRLAIVPCLCHCIVLMPNGHRSISTLPPYTHTHTHTHNIYSRCELLAHGGIILRLTWNIQKVIDVLLHSYEYYSYLLHIAYLVEITCLKNIFIL